MTHLVEQRDRRRTELNERTDAGRDEKQQLREKVAPKDRESDRNELPVNDRSRRGGDSKSHELACNSPSAPHGKRDAEGNAVFERSHGRIIEHPAEHRTPDPEPKGATRDPIRPQVEVRGQDPLNGPALKQPPANEQEQGNSKTDRNIERIRSSVDDESSRAPKSENPRERINSETAPRFVEKGSQGLGALVVEPRPALPATTVTQFVTEEIFKQSQGAFLPQRSEMPESIQRSVENQRQPEQVTSDLTRREEARLPTQWAVSEAPKVREEIRTEAVHLAQETVRTTAHKKVVSRAKEQSRLEKLKSRFCRRTRLTARPKRKGILGLLSRLFGGHTDLSGRR